MNQIEQPTRRLAPTDTYRILTLENPDNIEQLKEVCKEAGHEVVPVLTIEQAMLFLETKDHVDVIVAAAHLEEESIFDFLKRVKSSDSHLKDVPFLMICTEPGTLALLTSHVVELAADLMGAEKYLLMTAFDTEKLMNEINQLLPRIPSKELDSSDLE